jgi:hypothetical protein
MTITNRTAALLPTTSDGAAVLDFAEGFSNRLGFKDIGASGSGHLIVIGRTNGYLWLFWSTNGATWTPVQLMALPESSARIRAICQSDDGKIHLVLHRTSFAEINYHRFTPTYTSGVMSSFSQDTTWSILLDTINGDTRYDMQEVVTQDGSKYIAALCGMGDGSGYLRLLMTVFPRTATSATALKGINGTGSYTVITSGNYGGGTASNHDHAGLFTQNKSTKALIISVGFIEAEMPLSTDDLYHYFASTNGNTTWATSSLVQETNTHPYCVCSHYAVGTNVYRARFGNSTTPEVRIDKIDSAGSITYNAFPAFTASAVGGDYSGWVMLGISNDEAIAYVTTYSYWNYVRSGSCTGGTWTLSSEPDVGYAVGFGGFGHSRGAVGITTQTINVTGVWDDTADVSGPPTATVAASAEAPTAAASAVVEQPPLVAAVAASIGAPTATATATAHGVTFVAAGAVASGTAAISPALPAGIVTGDILLLALETANQAITIPTPNGGTWTEVTGSPQGTGTAAGTSATRLTLFWSRYNGTQGAPTTSDSGDHQVGVIVAYRGCVSTGNPWDVTSSGVEATSDTSWSITGATTTVTNCRVVVIGTRMNDLAGAHFSAWTNADLSNIQERFDDGTTQGNGGGIGIADGLKSTAGTYAATTVTNATTTVKAFMTVALNPVMPSGESLAATVTADSAAPTSTASATSGASLSASVTASVVAQTVSASAQSGAALSASCAASVAAPAASGSAQTGVAIAAAVAANSAVPTATATASTGNSLAATVSASVATPTVTATAALGNTLSATAAASAAAPTCSAVAQSGTALACTVAANNTSPTASASATIGGLLSATASASTVAPSATAVCLSGASLSAATTAATVAPTAAAVATSGASLAAATTASATAPTASASATLGSFISCVASANVGAPTVAASAVSGAALAGVISASAAAPACAATATAEQSSQSAAVAASVASPVASAVAVSGLSLTASVAANNNAPTGSAAAISGFQLLALAAASVAVATASAIGQSGSAITGDASAAVVAPTVAAVASVSTTATVSASTQAPTATATANIGASLTAACSVSAAAPTCFASAMLGEITVPANKTRSVPARLWRATPSARAHTRQV